MKSHARQVLAENLRALIAADQAGKSPSVRGWALSKKLEPMKVQRATKGSNGASVETLQELADATGRQPWELLVPGMKAPLPGVSAKAAELARLYDEIADKAERQKAYAIARLALTGNIQVETQRQGEEDEPPEPAAPPRPRQPARR